MRRHRSHRRFAGFSLLEISVVMLIIVTLMGSGIMMLTNKVAQEQEDITLKRMKAIQTALLQYRRAFDVIPCPASITAAIGNINFGRGTVKSSTVGAHCNATYTPTYSAGSYTWGGMVPVNTLKLPEEYAFDGWGHRFTYFVDDRYTSIAAFTRYTISMDTGEITVRDGTGATITSSAIYVLISHGPNGHGAVTREGSTRVDRGSTNANEYINCGCDSSANLTGFATNFVQSPRTGVETSGTNVFDDIVVFSKRSGMSAPFE